MASCPISVQEKLAYETVYRQGKNRYNTNNTGKEDDERIFDMEKDFAALGVMPALVEALGKQGITMPTDIQEKMIPALLTGQDIVGRSETGSGKTLSYLLPLFMKLDMKQRGTQVMILTPTHELAAQVHKQAELLAENAGMDVGCALIIGTAGIQRQIEKLKGKPRIVVGSTGRILDLIHKKKIQAHLVKTIVLDEGDRLLEDGNLSAVEAVIKTTLRDRQLVLLSASVSTETKKRAESIMKDNVLFLEGKEQQGTVPENISHYYILTTHREKFLMLRKILAGEKPKKAIVFLNNPENIEVTVDKLLHHGIEAAGIYGQAGKLERKNALDDFRAGRVSVLVASDIGARGLDISQVTHIINLDIPEDPVHYLHRAGRCGRQGERGCAISIVTPYERRFVHKYEKTWGISFAQKDMVGGKLTDSQKTKKDLDIKKKPPKKEKSSFQKAEKKNWKKTEKTARKKD